MKILRVLALVAMLLGFLFKVMHWPWAHALALSGFVMACIGALAPLLSGGVATPGALMRPLVGLLLYAGALMNILKLPGGNLAFYGMVVVAIVVLLSDRTHIELKRWDELGARPLLGIGALLTVSGLAFKVMHWPSANIQLILGIACAVVWTLVSGLRRKAVA